MGNRTYQQRNNQDTRIPVSQRRTEGGKVLEDNRAAFNATPSLGALKKNNPLTDQLAAMPQTSPTMAAQRNAVEIVNNSPYLTAQRQRLDNLTGGSTRQLKEEQTLPEKIEPVQRAEAHAPPNNTGLPDPLKSGIETLSGLSMDNVKVHYNSAKPAQLNALAYAQGTDIHVGPGQEQHLPHEAWHVVQQAQGRVKPTMQMKNGVQVNDDLGLEHEADVMGRKALASETVQMAGGESGTSGNIGADVRNKQQRLDFPALSASQLTAYPARDLINSDLHGMTVQCAYATRNYRLNNANRRLHVDYHAVNWGGTDPAVWPNRDNQRAILYETMTNANAAAVLANFAGIGGNIHDAGLSLVLNAPYIHNLDNTIRNPADPPVNAAVDPANQEATVKANLNAARTAALNAWAGPPVNISTLAWERKYLAGTVNPEPIRPAVPFASLRKEAASNPNANAIEDQLKVNRVDASVWHKIGDDDMTFHNPNGGSAQMGKLGEVEADWASANIVTFGYNLTTPGASPEVSGILSTLYYREMELRDAISTIAKTYPIEPNTYYKFDNDAQRDATWGAMEAQDVGGGGGQIKEGLKLMSAMQDNVGADLTRRDVFHTVSENTSAGGRNAAIVNVIAPWIAQAQLGNRPDPEQKPALRAAIVGLDQSYFDVAVWQSVALQLMPAAAVHVVSAEINAMVNLALDQLVDEIFNRIDNIVTIIELQAANNRIWQSGANGP